MGISCERDRGVPGWNPNRCSMSFPISIHNRESKKLRDLRSLGQRLPFTLRRAIKGRTHFLSTVHRAGICLTPDTPLPVPHVQHRRYLKFFIKAAPLKHGKVTNRNAYTRFSLFLTSHPPSHPSRLSKHFSFLSSLFSPP